ncbi:ferric reductase-like transmembrane domain-containing protein [Paenibacillus ferrarius]|uniref:ferric reductase-like transmembrane domain-containing protein n=1 Tax=Paenibacillus ferrarius TaxID=1469647 RepID=UPI003D2C61C1
MITWFVQLPVWTLVRVLGIGSFLSLSAGMVIGIIYGYPQMKGKKKAQLHRYHTYLNNAGTALALLHAVLLIIDTFMPFDWHEILVPFTAEHSPVLNGIGTVALYGLLLVLLTTDLRQKLRRKLWLTLHMLSYPIFVLALIHGLMLGTDRHLGIVQAMYAAAVLALIAATAGRYVSMRCEKRRKGLY